MMQQGRKLVVKIYNASKFVFMIVGNSTSADYAKDITAAMDKSWLKKLADTVKSARQSFENYDYSLALDAIETRFWDFATTMLKSSRNALIPPTTLQQSLRLSFLWIHLSNCWRLSARL